METPELGGKKSNFPLQHLIFDRQFTSGCSISTLLHENKKIPYFSKDNMRVIYTKILNSLKMNVRAIHLKSIRGNSNAITNLKA
jgi:hypothetical protein